MDAPLMTRLLMETDWENILNNDIDTATTQFIQAIHNAATTSIPTKYIRHRDNQKPWVNADLKRHIRKRERLFKNAKQTNTEYSWNRWRHQRNMVTTINRRLKNEYMQREVHKLLTQKPCPQKYHQTLRRIIGRSKTDTLPPLEAPNGDIIMQDFDKATLLNNHFSAQSTLNIPDSRQPPDSATHSRPIPTLDHIETCPQEVLRVLNALDPNKSTGPDNIPVKILKMTALLIAEPLSLLFNKSLAEGTFPSIFKVSHIRAIYKNKGSASDYTCYRPISILSAISKVFEKIVHRKIYTHINENSLLTEKQSGYRPNHSTEQQLLYLVHNLYKSLDEGNSFSAIYLDIAKYFDKIWHKGLLYKCKNNFGISGKLLEWLQSYLKDRKQSVKVNNTLSDPVYINAGCPQGSVLGPLLALIYLDDLSSRTQNDVLFFADDTSLYAPYSATDVKTTELSLQKDLDSIYEYGKAWAITFNTTKTIQQTFSHKQNYTSPSLKFGGDNIPVHETHTHLGITLSKDIRFHDHINAISKKVNRSLSLLYPIAQYLPRTILDQLYKTYIRPHFDYCDTVYDEHITIQDKTRLETLQNRAARLTTGALFRTSTDKLRRETGWDKLSTRRYMHRLSLYHTLSQRNSNIPEYITALIPRTRAQETNRDLRNAGDHTLARPKTTAYKRSFFINTSKQYNIIHQDIRNLNHTLFNKHLQKHIGIPKPPTYYTFGSKTGNTIQTQLRNEMSNLNSHLYAIQKVTSPACACGCKVESVRHYILSCPLYTEQRRSLFNSMSQTLNSNFTQYDPSQQLQILLHGTDLGCEDGRAVAHHFQSFVLNSHRFHL